MSKLTKKQAKNYRLLRKVNAFVEAQPLSEWESRKDASQKILDGMSEVIIEGKRYPLNDGRLSFQPYEKLNFWAPVHVYKKRSNKLFAKLPFERRDLPVLVREGELYFDIDSPLHREFSAYAIQKYLGIPTVPMTVIGTPGAAVAFSVGEHSPSLDDLLRNTLFYKESGDSLFSRTGGKYYSLTAFRAHFQDNQDLFFKQLGELLAFAYAISAYDIHNQNMHWDGVTLKVRDVEHAFYYGERERFALGYRYTLYSDSPLRDQVRESRGGLVKADINLTETHPRDIVPFQDGLLSYLIPVWLWCFEMDLYHEPLRNGFITFWNEKIRQNKDLQETIEGILDGFASQDIHLSCIESPPYAYRGKIHEHVQRKKSVARRLSEDPIPVFEKMWAYVCKKDEESSGRLSHPPDEVKYVTI